MAISKTRCKRYTKRRNLRKRRGTKRQRGRRTRRQYGGEREMTTSVTFDNPNEMNEEEYILARRMRIFD
jgi:hypothetical protein